MSYNLPKGTFDLLPRSCHQGDAWKQIHKWQYLTTKMREMSHAYGYEEIITPIFEKTELFSRSIGGETDIVSKEMYTFMDRANRSMTLRPEGTASVMRAFIEKNLHHEQSFHKFYYMGPMFRYERQQAGRYRQFYQFGVELIGLDCPEQDVELLDFLHTFFASLGLQNLSLHINSLGDETCRQNYRKALLDYLTPFHEQLSTESQKRLESNPLRILDSKNKDDQKILEHAPSILDFLEEDSKAHFLAVQKWLKVFKIPFVVNPKLVRGLDYYNRTVFEVVCGQLGAQDTLAAGGRYDRLIKQLGGPDLPAVGFALGFERLIQIMDAQNCTFKPSQAPLVFIIPLGELAKEVGFEWLKQIRMNQMSAEMDFSGKKLKHLLKYADKRQISYVLILGEEELKNEVVKLKHMESGDETAIPLDQLLLTLKNLTPSSKL